MTNRRMEQLSREFRSALLDDTIPFWLNHSTDRQFGGYTTFLDRKGDVLCPDKPMWVQGRIGWVMARLYNDIEKRPEWLAASKHAVDFILAHGFDTDGRVFYSVTREGKPLRKRRYLFAEIFAIMAFAEYGKAAGDAAIAGEVQAAHAVRPGPARETLECAGRPGAEGFPPDAAHARALHGDDPDQYAADPPAGRLFHDPPCLRPPDRRADRRGVPLLRQAGAESSPGDGRPEWRVPRRPSRGPVREPRSRHRDRLVHHGRGEAPQRWCASGASAGDPRLVPPPGMGREVRRHPVLRRRRREASRSSTSGT